MTFEAILEASFDPDKKIILNQENLTSNEVTEILYKELGAKYQQYSGTQVEASVKFNEPIDDERT